MPKLMTIVQKMINKTANPQWKISKGGKTKTLITELLDNLVEIYGEEVDSERIIDYIIYQIFRLKDRISSDTFNISTITSMKAVKGYMESNKKREYYEDIWLESNNVERDDFYELIRDKSKHTQNKFLFMPSEENTKMRFLNSETGFYLCDMSTLGWSPLSPACNLCEFVEKCKQATQSKFPELYRIRVEYEQGRK